MGLSDVFEILSGVLRPGGGYRPLQHVVRGSLALLSILTRLCMTRWWGNRSLIHVVLATSTVTAMLDPAIAATTAAATAIRTSAPVTRLVMIASITVTYPLPIVSITSLVAAIIVESETPIQPDATAEIYGTQTSAQVVDHLVVRARGIMTSTNLVESIAARKNDVAVGIIVAIGEVEEAGTVLSILHTTMSPCLLLAADESASQGMTAH